MSHSFPITVVMEDDSNRIASFYVESNQRIGEIKMILEAQWEIPASSLSLYFNGRPLNDADRFHTVGCTENDILQASVARQAPAMPSVDGVMRAQAQAVREQIRVNAQLQDDLRRTNPDLLQAALGNDDGQFQSLFIQQQTRMVEQRLKEAQRLAALNADPLNEENQRLIEQEIRKANIERNLEAAMEHNPEAFHRVCMLYVNLRLGNKQITAFVDSGAQSTIMSLQCAERLGILHLLDRRFTGIARGAGTSNIVGRIHYVEVQLGSHYIAVTLSVLDNVHIDFLLGLDMLKKHRMCIDLEKSCLRIGNDEVPFLQEHELPESVEKFEEEFKSASGTPKAGSAAAAAAAAAATPSPAAASSVSQPPPSAASSNNTAFNEQDILTLMGLGFTRMQAISALQSCHPRPNETCTDFCQ